MRVALQGADALVIVDVQEDFVSGRVAVPGARHVVAALDRYIDEFARRGLPIFTSRDWHPPDHCSFRERGGRWPAHCVVGTPGAAFAHGLALDDRAFVISKGLRSDREAYSAFDGTGLHGVLKRMGVRRLFVGGLATDYGVLETVRGALRRGFGVFLLADAVRALNLHPDDGEEAVRAMLRAGAISVRFEEIDVPEHTPG
jgi:nicotinamidase/pyrazinamidase